MTLGAPFATPSCRWLRTHFNTHFSNACSRGSERRGFLRTSERVAEANTRMRMRPISQPVYAASAERTRRHRAVRHGIRNSSAARESGMCGAEHADTQSVTNSQFLRTRICLRIICQSNGGVRLSVHARVCVIQQHVRVLYTRRTHGRERERSCRDPVTVNSLRISCEHACVHACAS